MSFTGLPVSQYCTSLCSKSSRSIPCSTLTCGKPFSTSVTRLQMWRLEGEFIDQSHLTLFILASSFFLKFSFYLRMLFLVSSSFLFPFLYLCVPLLSYLSCCVIWWVYTYSLFIISASIFLLSTYFSDIHFSVSLHFISLIYWFCLQFTIIFIFKKTDKNNGIFSRFITVAAF